MYIVKWANSNNCTRPVSVDIITALLYCMAIWTNISQHYEKYSQVYTHTYRYSQGSHCFSQHKILGLFQDLDFFGVLLEAGKDTDQ